MNEDAAWIIGCLAVVTLVIGIPVAIGMAVFQGLAFVVSAVDWAQVGYILQEIARAIAIIILVVLGLILALIIGVALYFNHLAARAREEERRRREIAKPRIPTTLTYREKEGVRQYNAGIRPDFEDLEKFRHSD